MAAYGSRIGHGPYHADEGRPATAERLEPRLLLSVADDLAALMGAGDSDADGVRDGIEVARGTDPYTLNDVETQVVAIGEGGYRSVTYAEADGTVVTVGLNKGTAGVRFTGTGLDVAEKGRTAQVEGQGVEVLDVGLLGTTKASTLSVRTKGIDKLATVYEIHGESPLGKLSAAGVDLLGVGLNLSGDDGWMGSVQLHDVLAGADIDLPGTGAAKGATIKARSLSAGTDVALGSPLKGLTVAEWGGSTLQAPWAGTISVKGSRKDGIRGDFAADVTLTGADAKGVALGKLSVVGLVAGSVVTASSGGVNTVQVGQWDGGSLTAEWLKSLKTKANSKDPEINGDFSAEVVLTGQPNPKKSTLGTARVTGDVVGAAWDITGSAGTIRLDGQVDQWQLAGAGGSLTLVKTLTLGEAGTDVQVTVDGELRNVKALQWSGGRLQAGSVGSLKVTGHRKSGLAGDFGADVTLTGHGDRRTPTLRSARVAGDVIGAAWDISGDVGTLRVDGLADQWQLAGAGGLTLVKTLTLGEAGTDVQVTVDGELRNVKARQWAGGDIEAAFVGSLKVTGHRPSGLAGDFGADVTLSGSALPKKRALGSANVAGEILGSTWQVHGDVGTVKVGGDVDGWDFSVQPGPAGSAQQGGLKGLTLGAVGDATVQVDDALGSVKALRWADGLLKADQIKTLRVTGRKATKKAPGVFGDFTAGLVVEGTGVAAGKRVLGTAVIAGILDVGSGGPGGPAPAGEQGLIDGDVGTLKVGVLGGALRIAGDARSVTVGDLEALLEIDGDARSVRLKERMGIVEAGDSNGRLKVGGKANVSDGKRRLTFTDAEVYDNDRYRLEDDLRLYNVPGAWWEYDLEFNVLGVHGFDTNTDHVLWSDGSNYAVEVVSGNDQNARLEVSYSTGSQGEVCVESSRLDFASGYAETWYDNHPMLTPEVVRLEERYQTLDSLSGDFVIDLGIGDEAVGHYEGKGKVSLRFFGLEQVTVPAGTFLAVKCEIAAAFSGAKVDMNIFGMSFEGTIGITQKQTCWLAPGIGGVKAITTQRVSASVAGYRFSYSYTLTQELTDASTLP